MRACGALRPAARSDLRRVREAPGNLARGMRQRKRAFRAGWLASLATVCLAVGAQAASASDLSYYGGPVSHSMTGVIVDWGTGQNPSFRDESGGDPGLIKYWASQNGTNGDLGGILAQYMDKSGRNSANRVAYEAQHQITPINNSPVLTDADIQTELTSQIAQKHLPAPAGDGLSTIYNVLLPPTRQVCDPNLMGCSGVVFCAYHGSAQLPSGTWVLYSVVPEGGGCNTTLDEQTVSFSHEWGETINDPLVAEDTSPNIGPPVAWYDDTNHPNEPGEIGDKCEGGPRVVNGQWAVAQLWSNRDGLCASGESSLKAPDPSFVVDSATAGGKRVLFDGRGSRSSSSNSAVATDIGDAGNKTYSIRPGIATYDWHWGDGKGDGSGATPRHTFSHPGVYQVTLNVSDNLGFTSSTTQQICVGRTSAGLGCPDVRTGGHRVHRRSARLKARVNPHGLPTHYFFQFGRTKRYGRSSPHRFAGSGNKAKLVKAKLAGLRPGTVYHYRIVATNARGTSVGVDKKFTIGGRKLRHTVRLRLSVRTQRTRVVEASGLRASFSCSQACDVHAAALRYVGRPAALRVMPVTVAKGSAHLDHAGSGTLILVVTPAARNLLLARQQFGIVVSALAQVDQSGAGIPAATTTNLLR